MARSKRPLVTGVAEEGGEKVEGRSMGCGVLACPLALEVVSFWATGFRAGTAAFIYEGIAMEMGRLLVLVVLSAYSEYFGFSKDSMDETLLGLSCSESPGLARLKCCIMEF